MIQISVKQLVILGLITAAVAASLVIGYDRYVDRAALSAEGQQSAKTVPASDPAIGDDERNNIEIYRAVSPGVVNIRTITPVRDFFAAYEAEGGGSGSIIDEQGHILTNYHVVQGAERLYVTMADGSAYEAKRIGIDPDSDLAVIKIDAPRKKLTVARMGDSDHLAVGQKVLAIGNPFGIGQTLTQGIISALGRPIRAKNNRLIESAIQTDASINPGNSGGALLNSKGEMIGINSQIISPSEGSVGIGFAIPVNLAKRFIPDMIALGHVVRPYLGITHLRLSPQIARALELEVDSGILVQQTVRGGPADRAGIQGGNRLVRFSNNVFYLGGDVLVELDGEATKSMDDLTRVLNRHRPDDTVKSIVVRQGRRIEVPIKLQENPAREE